MPRIESRGNQVDKETFALKKVKTEARLATSQIVDSSQMWWPIKLKKAGAKRLRKAVPKQWITHRKLAQELAKPSQWLFLRFVVGRSTVPRDSVCTESYLAKFDL